jgi:hypothetical protein
MTTKLKSRVVRLEQDLRARHDAAGRLDFGLEEVQRLYVRLHTELYRTLPLQYMDEVSTELRLKRRHGELLRRAAREDEFRPRRTSRRATVPRPRLSPLTLSFIGRLERAVRGDRRPLALPLKVCNLYAWAWRYKRGEIPIRECETCGYDTPALPRVTYRAALNVLAGTSYAIDTHLTFAITSCPVCGGALAPEGERPWSERNPDKVVDLHVWPDGEVTLLD